jgi:hypothetical protein
LIQQLGGCMEPPLCLPQPVLDSEACATLTRYLDDQANAHRRHQANASNTDDLILLLSLDELTALIGKNKLDSAVQAWRTSVRENFDTIKLRRVAATGHCAPFHTDYSKRTMQIALTDDSEYDGGRLVFATASGFVVPSRPRGSATIHGAGHVHGVSTLTRGVRYGLFFCNEDQKKAETASGCTA